jgi:NADPH-dependent curcumin reductase CurA
MQVVPATALGGLQKISSEVLNTLKASKTPLSTFVGALGMTGFSA